MGTVPGQLVNSEIRGVSLPRAGRSVQGGGGSRGPIRRTNRGPGLEREQDLATSGYGFDAFSNSRFQFVAVGKARGLATGANGDVSLTGETAGSLLKYY